MRLPRAYRPPALPRVIFPLLGDVGFVAEGARPDDFRRLSVGRGPGGALRLIPVRILLVGDALWSKTTALDTDLSSACAKPT